MYAAVVLAFIITCAGAHGHKPQSCTNLECPEFTVLQNTSDYELRHYSPSMWVRTESIVRNGGWMDLKTTLFRRLFAYIRGANDRGLTIDMTAPVLAKLVPGTPVHPDMVMTMYFLLPAALRSNPPTPTSPLVTVDSWPEKQVYVRSFGGWARRQESLFELAQLRSAIGDETLYDDNYVIKAGYDGPRKRRNRHNEIWLVKL